MQRPDTGLIGPERATMGDVDALNRLFAEAFTDRYHRDGMSSVRVPFLSREIWRYAIEDAGEGAMLWRDEDGQLVAFNMVHLSGVEGWMGPLAVRPALQGGGAGSQVVRAGIASLRRRGAKVLGLETMPRTVENIGFYSRIGFAPGHLTVTMVRELEGKSPDRAVGRLVSRSDNPEALFAATRDLTQSLAPGVDYGRELALTLDLGLGDTTILEGQDGRPLGFALWHTAALAQGRPNDELRILKIVARDPAAFRALIRAIEGHAMSRGTIQRVSLRCQTAYRDAYLSLLEDGYRVHWTDLRMTMPDAPERSTAPGIVMSNWEI
ncbi:MAG TPA: GNAT family N-acetyltransferase [Gemmatimonadales bacterium]|nr:GNAT family N-acetyltransferase [Gemmatimonadales bacterium]